MSHAPITGDGVVLRPTTEADLDVARALFTDPGFYERWDGYPKPDDEIAAKYLGRRSPSVECFFVVEDDAVVGFTQYHRVGAAGGGMDLVLLPAARGRGVGTRVVHAMADFVRTQLGWTRFSVDPDVSNERGVHFWDQVGFTPIRVVDEGEREPYWHMEWPFDG